MSARLYTVLASLPHLPHFAESTRLPISEARLLERIGMAMEPERATLLEVYDLLVWHRGSEHESDTTLLHRFRTMLANSPSPTVRTLLLERLGIRLLLTALRYQLQGAPKLPEHLEAFDLLPILHTVRARFRQPGFGLTAKYPELLKAEAMLRERRSADLERLLFERTWATLDERAALCRARAPFGLDELIVYVFKWDLTYRWLTYNGEVAVQRFERIIASLVGPELGRQP